VFLGSTPIGAPLLGWVCALAGARAGLWVAAVTSLLAAAAAWPALRRAGPPAPAAMPVPAADPAPLSTVEASAVEPSALALGSAVDAELPE
jgi:hypothetical protein